MKVTPYETELDRLRGERVVLRGMLQDALCYLDRVAEADIGFEPGTSSRTLHWLRDDLRNAITTIERDRAKSIAAPPQPDTGNKCLWDVPCRQRSVMLRRHVAKHPGDHIEPAVFERLEALLPKRLDTYHPERFALVLNAVLTAGMDAIHTGRARPEYTYRGVTLLLEWRNVDEKA